MEFYSARKKNEILPFAGKWMELEEHHSESGQPGLEDQKSYVLPHMQTLDLGQKQQCGRTWITGQGKSTYGRDRNM
jgi:hypothetical protein